VPALALASTGVLIVGGVIYMVLAVLGQFAGLDAAQSVRRL